MQRDAMPRGDQLRQMTCLVAENMFGSALEAVSYDAGADGWRPERTVTLRLAGSPDFTVFLGWQRAHQVGLQRLFCGDGAAGPDDEPLVLDALGELLNIVAGQLKAELALEHSLGLPTFAPQVPDAVRAAGLTDASGWVKQRGGGPALLVGAYPSAAVGQGHGHPPKRSRK